MSTTTPAQARETFTLSLDASLPLAEQIQLGKYRFVNEYYTPENFKLTLSGEREVFLFDPGGSISSEEMIRRMKQDGFVPATVDDALAFGAQHPNRQKQNPIVFLGTVFRDPDGGRHVPVLFYWDGERKLNLSWFVSGWSSDYRFAAVRES